MNNIDLELKEIINSSIENFDFFSKENTVESFIDQILFYFNVSYDYGLESYCISYDFFSEEEISKFPVKVEKLFERAIKQYPNSLELNFWRLYINELNSFSNGFYKDQILDILKKEDHLLMYFYLHIQCGISNNDKLSVLKENLVNEKKGYQKFYMLPYLSDIN